MRLFAARDHGFADKFSKNVAAARVMIDDVETVLYGISRGEVDGEWVHSEDDIIAQIEDYRSRGSKIGKITELYSDRQLCYVCEGKLAAVSR
jgi:Xanthomonas XOO_2897-like deaminase